MSTMPTARQVIALRDKLTAFRNSLTPGERAAFDAILAGARRAAEVSGYDGGSWLQILVALGLAPVADTTADITDGTSNTLFGRPGR